MQPGYFAHLPLGRPSEEIRLLRLSLEKKTSHDISCSILHYAIDEVPAYFAISYTWGSHAERKACMIMVNGQRCSVSYNSWYALWQMKYHEVSSLLWIDAICIRQDDDFEKTRQVNIMGDIFKKASSVCACVGPHENGSEILAEHLQSHSSFMMRRRQELREQDHGAPLKRCSSCSAFVGPVYHSCQQCQVAFCQRCTIAAQSGEHEEHGFLVKDRYGPLDRPPSDISDQFGSYERFSWFPTDHMQHLLDALRAFSLRIYFRRLWIVQEIGLARRITVYCGTSTFDWAGLELIVKGTEAWMTRMYASGASESGSVIRLEMVSHNFCLLCEDVRHEGFNVDLWDLVHSYSTWSCFDARDKIFGLLALADWSASPVIRADYTKSTFAVSVDLLRSRCRVGKDFQPLTDADTMDMGEVMRVLGCMGVTSSNEDVVEHLLLARQPTSQANEGHDGQSIGIQERVIVKAAVSYTLFQGSDDCLTTSRCITNSYGSKWTWPPDAKQAFQHTRDLCRESSHPIFDSSEIIAVAHKDAKPGDVLLGWGKPQCETGLEIPAAGLVVRALDSDYFSIIGQVIYIPEAMESPSDYDAGIKSSESRQSDYDWYVHFDPQDLAVFVAQGMTGAYSPENEKHMESNSLQADLEETSKRFETRVTSGLMSSFVTCVSRGNN